MTDPINGLRLNVSDVQYFSVGDGDGIRTTLFLKGCNLRCPWCHNPETVSPRSETLFYASNGKSVTHGRLMTADELFPLLTRDSDFFRESGGGVTVSGGEPLLQSRALVPLLERLRAAGIHVAIDTAGCVPKSSLEEVTDLADCFLFDYKSASPEIYSRVIGGSLSLAEENLRFLMDAKKEVRLRIPLIPGINDSPDDCEAICLRLEPLGIKRVDILPFHRLGVGKYEAMGIPYAYAHVPPHSRERVSEAADIYRRHFEVTVEK